MNFVNNEISKMWILWKLRFQNGEFCENWDFRNVNFEKNEISERWIMWKMRFQKSEFCENWDFRNVNFVKIEIPEMWIVWKMRFLKIIYKSRIWSGFILMIFFLISGPTKKWLDYNVPVNPSEPSYRLCCEKLKWKSTTWSEWLNRSRKKTRNWLLFVMNWFPKWVAK